MFKKLVILSAGISVLPFFLQELSVKAWGEESPPTQARKGILLDRLEASVNTSTVLLSDVKHFRKVMKLRSQLDPLFAGTPLANKGAEATSAEIVNFLIEEKLISQQFPVGDTEVEQEINSIQSNNKIDRAGLKAALADQGFSFNDYFELIRSSASKRNLIDRDIRSKVVISDDDIRNYFYNHYAKSSDTPRAFHIRLISVSSKNYKTPQAAYSVAVQGLQDIKKGDSFEEVAKRISDDPSAQTGGDYGTLTEDQMAPAIRDRVKKLEIGGMSDLFEIGNPPIYAFVKLVSVQTSDSSQYEKLKESIRNQLSAQEFQHQISLWLERQKQNAFIHRANESSAQGTRSVP